MHKKEEGFLRALSEDVLHALHQVGDNATVTDRRNALRAIISAAEGLAWIYRSHVVSIARDMEAIAPLEEMAFAEVSVFVSEAGKVSKQPRNLSMTASIRLTTNVAKSLAPELIVDFGTTEWENLKSAIKARNRVTHPKGSLDLIVSDDDIGRARSGFFWLVTLVGNVMERTVEAYSEYVAGITDVVGDLIKGDPQTVAMYRRALKEGGDPG